MTRSQELKSSPNILFIMADQHRYDALGYAGAEWVRTPNLDRLAERGVWFHHCYSNCPVCAPARIGIATGQLPIRMGALDNNAYLPLSARTYYQRLRDHGYRVGCVGKLDLAKPDGYNGRHGDRPCTYAWGFTHPVECEGKMHAGRADPDPIGPYTFWLEEQGLRETFVKDYKERARQGWSSLAASNDSALPTEAWEDGYIGRRSAEWIETIPDDFPWHLFVSFVGPHDPFDPPTEYAERYRDAEMPDAVPPSEDPSLPAWMQDRFKNLAPEHVVRTRRQYAAEVEAIDAEIGRILEALDRRGMMENTVILFSSDHGEMLGDHGAYTKCYPHDPSMRVPLLAAGPGVTARGKSDALVELIDINPTLCELAGLAPQENIDGRSFAPVLRGEDESHRDAVVAAMERWRAIRDGRFKLVQSMNDATVLFDCERDPTETRNCLEAHPDVAQQLAGRLAGRLTEGQWRR